MPCSRRELDLIIRLRVRADHRFTFDFSSNDSAVDEPLSVLYLKLSLSGRIFIVDSVRSRYSDHFIFLYVADRVFSSSFSVLIRVDRSFSQ